MSPGSTLLSYPLPVRLISSNGKSTEDKEVTSGGYLVID